MARSITSGTETDSMFQVNLPASILARSSTSSMSLVRRSPSLTTTLRLSITCRLVCWILRSSSGNQGEDAFFQAAANNLGEAEHGSERRAQFMADGGEEGTLGGVGVLGGGAGLAGVFEKPGVVDGDSHRGGDGRQQTLIGFGEAAFLVGGLHADDADHFAAGRNGYAEVGGGGGGPGGWTPKRARLPSKSSLMSRGWPVRMICEVNPSPKGRDSESSP